MKIFNVTAEQTHILSTMVMARNETEAKYQVFKAIRTKELVFDEDYAPSITECREHEISDPVVFTKYVKNNGILNEKGDVVYDSATIKEILNENKKKMKEEFLKKHHMEFNFGET